MESVLAVIFLALLVLPVVGVILGIISLRRAARLKVEIRQLGERLEQILQGGPGIPPQPAAAPPAPTPTAAPVRPTERERVVLSPVAPPSAELPPPPGPPPGVVPTPPPAPGEAPTLEFEPPVGGAAPAPGAGATRGPSLAEDAPPPGGEDAAARRRLWEKRLSGQLPVWLGAIAVALAGVFLVHYSLQRELITPTLRVALGLAAGVICLAVAEFLARRQELLAHAVSAAGIAILFAALVAGVTLYHLIPPVPGFLLIVLTTLGGVALSLRRGPMVALIGLLGGFITPALIGAKEPSPIPLFTFFLVLQVGLFFVIRRRGWWLLGALASGGGLLWAAVWMAFRLESTDRVVLGLFLLAALGTALGMGRGRATGGKTASPMGAILPRVITIASAAAGALLLGVLAQRAGYGVMEWAFLGVLGAGLLLVGRWDERYHLLPWVGLGTNLVLFLLWEPLLSPDQWHRFLWTLAASGALYALGGYAAHFRTKTAPMWASLSVVALLGHFLLGWARLGERVGEHTWGVAALVLAMLATLAALPHLRRRSGEPVVEKSLAALLVGATTLISMAVPLELERAFISVAWALEALMLAWLAGRLRVSALRWLSAALAAGVAMRLLLNPSVLHYPLGEHPLLSWLHYGYGIPALAFGATCWLYVRQGQTQLARWMEWGAVALGWAYLGLLVRQYYSPGHLTGPLTQFAELGCYGIIWMAYGALLFLAGEKIDRKELMLDGRVVFYGCLGFVILVPGLVSNPMIGSLAVGTTPLLNGVLFSLGLPAALVLLAARRLTAGRKEFALASLCAGLWLCFLTLSLEIRQFFHGSRLSQGATSNSELYSYSVAWVLFGIGLLALGIWRKTTAIRFAALLVMSVAVGKVFLFDFSHLGGLYRVFSFLGLGLSLFAFYYLYQRFVARGNE